GGGQHLGGRIELNAEPPRSPAGDGFPQAGLADHGRVLRDRVERVDQRLADERRRRFGGGAAPRGGGLYATPAPVGLCDGPRGRGDGATRSARRAGISSSLRVTRAISSAGPRIQTWPLSSSQIGSSPPGITTVRPRSTSPR